MEELKTIEEEYNDIKRQEDKQCIYQLDLYNECYKQQYNMNKIILLVKLVDNINVQYKHDYSTFKCELNIQHQSEFFFPGNTALHFASQLKNNLEVIKYLVEHGANVNLQNKYGETALHNASEVKNNLEIVKYLVEHDANINLQTNCGYTALHKASNLENNIKVVNYLRANGAKYSFFGFKY